MQERTILTSSLSKSFSVTGKSSKLHEPNYFFEETKSLMMCIPFLYSYFFKILITFLPRLPTRPEAESLVLIFYFIFNAY